MTYTLRAWRSLACIHRTLRDRNLEGLSLCLGSDCPRREDGTSERELALMVAAVDTASAMYFRPSTCVHRSAALVRLLRRHGIGADLVFGVRAKPYGGHAWVEVLDRVVNDDPSVQSEFTVVQRM